MNKILTIVIPTYNMEQYLEKCLTSLIINDRESLSLLEVLVVNDGSKDKSSEIAHKFELQYPGTFRVIDKENGNYGSCINCGIKEANGKYFKILDSDDWYNTKELEKFVKILKNSDTDLYVTNYIHVDENKQTKLKVSVPLDMDGKTVKYVDFDWKKQANPLLLSMHAFTIRLALLRENQYRQQEGISYTDTEFNYFCLLFANTISFANLNIYNYLIGREGQTVSPAAASKRSDNKLKVSKRLIEDYLNRNEDSKRLETIIIPIIKVASSYFYTELFIKENGLIDKQGVLSLIKMCNESNITLNEFKYRGIPYVSCYKVFGLSFHWLYILTSQISRKRWFKFFC